MKSSFKIGTALVFKPVWAINQPHFMEKTKGKHPIEFGEIVYFLADIPNIPGHCIVLKESGEAVPNVHPGDFRKATDQEL